VGLGTLFSLMDAFHSLVTSEVKLPSDHILYNRVLVPRCIMTLACDKYVLETTGRVIEGKTPETDIVRLLTTMDPCVARVAMDKNGTWWFGIQALAAALDEGDFYVAAGLKDKVTFDKNYSRRVGQHAPDMQHATFLQDLKSLTDYGLTANWISSTCDVTPVTRVTRFVFNEEETKAMLLIDSV